jgi:hypothetical protein
MSGWGYYVVYDSARSNPIAEACYFAQHRRLVIIAFGDQEGSGVIDIPYPGLVEHDATSTPNAIGVLLKERFQTRYVVHHPFCNGEWV